jgi:hypothetical protein
MRSALRILAIGALIAAAAAGRLFAAELRDPMRPSGSPAAAPAPRAQAPSTLRLEGVIAGGKFVAIVNGRLVRAGDVIAGARILEVFASGVRYERAGKVSILTLPAARAHAAVRVARSSNDKAPEGPP